MSIVLDTSVLVEVLQDSQAGRSARPILSAHAGQIHIPELAVVEVVSALRGLCRGGQVNPVLAEQILTDFSDFPARRWPMDTLIPRVWALRDAVTSYDAVYIALAEELGATLVTMDSRLYRGALPLAQCPLRLIPDQSGSTD